MKYRWLAPVILITLLVVFAGCTRPDTPQQVATAFWEAVAEGDADDAVNLSTLASTGAFEGLGGDFLNTLPAFGRVVIEADQAAIETTLTTNQSAGEADENDRREITTYLVRVNDQWLVDYQRTYDAATKPSPLKGLKSEISRLREQFNDAVGQSSEQISKQIDQITKDLEAYSDETGEKAEQLLEGFGKSLKELRDEIRDSIDEAQKNRQKPNQPDQGALDQAAI